MEYPGQFIQESATGTIGGLRRLLRHSNRTLPLNSMPDGTCRTLKAVYFKTGRINFQYHNDWGTTGATLIYETL